MTGIAYDAAYPDLPAILARNPIYVDCYTDGPYAYGADKIAQIHAHGAGVKWNHERAPDQLKSGTPGGNAAALAAVAAVLAQGTPSDGTVAIFYSVDVNAPQSDFSAYGAAFDEINRIHAGRFLAGVYGEGALIDYLVTTKRVQVKGWLSGSSSFPGYNRNDPNVGEYQLVGSDVAGTDKDVVTDALHMGIWWAGAAPLGSGALITTTEDDMTPDQEAALDRADKAAQLILGLEAGTLSCPPNSFTTTYKIAQATYSAVTEVLAALTDTTNGVVVQIAAVRKALADQSDTAPTNGAVDLSGVVAQLQAIEASLAGLPKSVRDQLGASPLVVTLDPVTGKAA